MNQFLNIVFYFIIYSFLGWIIESVFKTLCERKLVNSGFLHGPFCPIYGIGALIMYFCLKNFSGNAFIVFCLGFVVLSIWEYVVGAFLEKVFNTKYWDYSNNKYNLQGRVCLTNSVFWGILGIIFIYFVHPFVEEKLSIINNDIICYISIAIVIYLIIDTTISITKVLQIDSNLSKIEDLNIKIKNKLEEIKLKGKNIGIGNTTDAAKDMLNKLNKKKNRINRRLYKTAYRLKKAFPSIQSESFNKILELKNELKRKKK